jgi:hypothetical protein
MQKRRRVWNKRAILQNFGHPFSAEAQVTYLTFILLTLQTLTKLKTTFGHNLLYWML